MKKGKKLNIRSYALDCMFFSSFSLLAIALGYILGPEFLAQTFAEEPAANPGTITMTITPLDAAQQGNIRVHKPSADGDFYTVGFGINVETANTYGYQLSMRSQRPNARLEYGDGDFADTVYIDPITSDLAVDIPNNNTFNEKNHYGWSTDWNPITQKGTFHGFDSPASGASSNTTVSPSNIVARTATLKRTLGPSATGGDKLDLYFGVNVSDTLLQGRYTGKIILTAISNSLSDISTTYTLHYDGNATAGSITSGMPSDPSSFVVVEGGEMGQFTIDSSIPVRSGFTFLGWSRDKRATSAEFVGGNKFTPNEANTTLYAIWQQSFTIILSDGNGGTFDTVTCDNTQSCVITLPSNTPSKSGFTFAYWLDTYYNRTYQPGDTITLTYDHPSLNLTPVFVPASSALTSGNPSSQTGDSEKAGALGEDTLKDLPEDVLEVIRLIQLLPDADKVSLKDKDLIEQTRAAYDKLSDENKALISATLISKYNSVLAAYYSLANGEADNGNLIIAACAGAAVATIALTALLIVKKSDDDDDEEEEK